MDYDKEDKKVMKKRILRTYFAYHIPFIILSLILFYISYYIGVHTKTGFTAMLLGLVFLGLMPPISLYLTKKKFSHIYKK